MRIELMTFALQKQCSNQLSYCGNRPELGIEPRTSCSQSKNHTTRPFWQMHRPGIEPGSLAWKANILTTIPTMLIISTAGVEPAT